MVRTDDGCTGASELTTVFGPVLGTHTGQGAVAVAAAPVDSRSD